MTSSQALKVKSQNRPWPGTGSGRSKVWGGFLFSSYSPQPSLLLILILSLWLWLR